MFKRIIFAGVRFFIFWFIMMFGNNFTLTLNQYGVNKSFRYFLRNLRIAKNAVGRALNLVCAINGVHLLNCCSRAGIQACQFIWRLKLTFIYEVIFGEKRLAFERLLLKFLIMCLTLFFLFIKELSLHFN